MHAQFTTPPPPALPSALVLSEELAYRFQRFLDAETHLAISEGRITVANLKSLRATFCALPDSPYPRGEACEELISADSIVASKSAAARKRHRALLPFGLPGSHQRPDVADYLRAATGTSGLALFNQFAASVSDKEAYVVTNAISGLAGRTIFAIDYAAVLVRDTAGSAASRREVEDAKSTIIRMINNGGTVAARLQWPIHAKGGTTFQSASSLSTRFGLIGPAGKSDSLRFSGAVVGEFMGALSIRDPGVSGNLLGELLLGLRVGMAYSEAPLTTMADDKSLGFIQLAVGLRQESKIGLSALVTWPLEERYKGLTPRLVLNLSAVR
ncbi:MAG: hypothetical protein SFU84_11300 [Gemmatimonadales bacterium]|nr:hypothetical protein [Gemmatimonadales bacterium]